jgi:hypothetical protein
MFGVAAGVATLAAIAVTDVTDVETRWPVGWRAPLRSRIGR